MLQIYYYYYEKSYTQKRYRRNEAHIIMYGPNPFFNLPDDSYNDIQSFQKIGIASNASCYKQLFYQDAMWNIDHFLDENAQNFPLHLHDYLEVILFLHGNIDYLVESKLYRINPADIVLIPKGYFHRPHILNSQLAYERIVVWMTNEALKELSTPEIDLMYCIRYISEKQYFLIPEQAPENFLIRTAMQQLAHLQTGDIYGKKLLITGFLREIILYSYQSALSPALSPQRIVKSPLITAAVDYISHHLSDQITLESLSDRLFVSKYHLAHTFKHHMGVSLHQYIISKRMLLAKKLIARGQPFNTVCTDCGFNNYSNFFKVFKANVGLSPRDYLNALIADHDFENS